MLFAAIGPAFFRLLLPIPGADREAIERYIAGRNERVVKIAKSLAGGPVMGRAKVGWRHVGDEATRRLARLPPRPYRVTAVDLGGSRIVRRLAVVGLDDAGQGIVRENP